LNLNEENKILLSNRVLKTWFTAFYSSFLHVIPKK